MSQRWITCILGGMAAVVIYAVLLYIGGELVRFFLYMPWHVMLLVLFVIFLRLDPSIQTVEQLSLSGERCCLVRNRSGDNRACDPHIPLVGRCNVGGYHRTCVGRLRRAHNIDGSGWELRRWITNE